MPPVGAKSDSMMDGLRKLLSELAQMQTYPDADIDFLSQLSQILVGKIRSSLNAPGQMGAGQPGGQPGGPGLPSPGGPPGGPPGMPGMPPGAPAPMGGPAMGLSATGGAPGAPNMDELARALGGVGAAQ